MSCNNSYQNRESDNDASTISTTVRNFESNESPPSPNYFVCEKVFTYQQLPIVRDKSVHSNTLLPNGQTLNQTSSSFDDKTMANGIYLIVVLCCFGVTTLGVKSKRGMLSYFWSSTLVLFLSTIAYLILGAYRLV